MVSELGAETCPLCQISQSPQEDLKGGIQLGHVHATCMCVLCMCYTARFAGSLQGSGTIFSILL